MHSRRTSASEMGRCCFSSGQSNTCAPSRKAFGVQHRWRCGYHRSGNVEFDGIFSHVAGPFHRKAAAMKSSLGDTIAKNAELLLKEVQHTESSREPQVDPKAGKYVVDDAGFMAFLLEPSMPESLARIPKAAPPGFPRVTDFCTFFAPPSQPGHEGIHRLADAGPGDIIFGSNPRMRAATGSRALRRS
jgi:hypothetical protein